MILFKAISYNDNATKTMSSVFKPKFKMESCMEDLIKTAFTHISHKDKMLEENKDYWISATKDMSTAVGYLYNTKYNFNGIAVIELPQTNYSGYIYDKILREHGYLDKEYIDGKLKNKWQPNSDGIVTIWDMSSEFTITYLSSHLWLKGNQKTLGNIRSIRNAQKSDEVLILGEDIKFFFIHKDEITTDIANTAPQIINNYHAKVFFSIINAAPESPIKERAKELNPDYCWDDSSSEYKDFLLDNLHFAMDSNGDSLTGMEKDEYVVRELMEKHYIDENELKKEFESKKRLELIQRFNSFYGNACYCFDRTKTYNRFYEFPKLSYADKDAIDFEEYDCVKPYEQKNFFENCLYAYIYSSCYISLKLNEASSEYEPYTSIFGVLNLLYSNKFMCETVPAEIFFNYYTNALGIYRSIEFKRR